MGAEECSPSSLFSLEPEACILRGMKVFSAETRLKMSEAAKRRCTPEERARRSIAYRAKVDDDVVARLYQSGMTVVEVATVLGLTRKPVERSLARSGVTLRKAARRDQWGPKNHMWKGHAAGLTPLHRRLDRRFGSPRHCSVCGSTDAARTYDWANLTGNYAELSDYKRMCRSCHRLFDNRRRRLRAGTE